MSETSGDDDGDRGAPPGTSDDSSAATEPTGDTSPSEQELRRRRTQSDLDRERAENARLRKQLEARGRPDDERSLDADAIRAQVRAEVARERALVDTAAELRQEFPYAAALLADPASFDGPEDMRYRASEHHARVQSERDSLAEDVARKVREEYGEKLAGTPAGGGNQPPADSDRLTTGAVAQMGFRDLMATSEEDLAKLARSIPQE